MSPDRFARQIPFLTEDGQIRLERARVAIVGVGGLGSHTVQQLAYLGIVNLSLIDHDRVASTNLNRLVTAQPGDIDRLKVDVLGDFVEALHPGAEIVRVPKDLRSVAAFEAIKSADERHSEFPPGDN